MTTPDGSPAASGAASRSDALWPLTGRAEELRAAQAAVRAGGVVLSGAPGVGKTRLAGQLLDAASPRWRPQWFTATDSSRSVALGVFGALASDSALGADTLVRTQRLVSALSAAAPGRRVLIGLDDAHFLDEVSAFVVYQLVVRRLASVVLTVRSHTPCPDAITALWKDGLLDRLELQPLSESEIHHLVETALEGAIESTSFRRLWEITRGNTLFLRQIIGDERAAGRLHRAGPVWVWDGQPAVSPGLSDLIARRMGRLEEPVREVVDVLALAEPIDVAVLLELADLSALEQAERQQLVDIARAGGDGWCGWRIHCSGKPAGWWPAKYGCAGCAAAWPTRSKVSTTPIREP